jgi:hypothetical protein
MSYLNRADPYDPRNRLTHHGLLDLEVTVGAGISDPGAYVQRLTTAAPDVRLSPFTHWWSETVIKDQGGQMWSREDVVLELANRLHTK